MQMTIKAKVPRQVYYAQLVAFWQLDIQAAVGQNVAQQRLAGYSYLRKSRGQTTGIKFLACEPGVYLAYELTRHGITRQCTYRLRDLAGECTAVTYSEQVVAIRKGRWRGWWQALYHCLTISLAARRLMRGDEQPAANAAAALPIAGELEKEIG